MLTRVILLKPCHLQWPLQLVLGGNVARPEDEPALANPKSLTELLRVSSLRSVCFMSSLSHAPCTRSYFCTEDSADMMANGLGKNTLVIIHYSRVEAY
jgi:hypothetical protein